MKIYIDGRLYAREDARISVFDHGLLYGDGVFEGVRIYARRVFRLDAHLARLAASAHAIGLALPLDRAQLAEAVRETVRANRQSDGYIRLVVTRGDGPLGLDPTTCARPRVIIIVADVAVYPAALYESGIRIVTAATRQVPVASVDPRIKSLNYLKNVLARLEAHAAGAAEALMLNGDGFVAECTADNVFAVRDGIVRTPPATEGALDGITRAVVRELAAESGLAFREERLARYDLFTANECFLSGTGAELVPVVALDGRPIADGRPGALTRRLTAGLRALAEREGEPVF
ncbi:MAG: branched-chain-amino-acid transaminase [Deltaproteobacteria bacterium]|nr:MAG: branched-chain-amino-acid transaminase [Deltaproteobacteria bacterium]